LDFDEIKSADEGKRPAAPSMLVNSSKAEFRTGDALPGRYGYLPHGALELQSDIVLMNLGY
jgi:hypothetical protein